MAVLKPIRAGDSTLLRGRIIGDTTGRPWVVVWTSSAPKVVRVNARTGRLVAVAEGAATITGRWGNATAKVPVRVLPPAPVAQAGKPEPLVLTELIATEIKSALREGDTIRLTAAALDQHGRSLLDRRVTWSAERPDIASVDVWGLVTAHRVGKTQIVATLEQHSVKVPVTVVPRPVAASDVATALRARADEFLAALTERNAERLTALYFPGGSVGGESEQDRKNLDWLIDKFRPEANLRVTRAQIRKPDVRDTEAVTELSLRLTWTQPSGKDRDTNANFRARFSKAADGWQLDGIRAVKNLE